MSPEWGDFVAVVGHPRGAPLTVYLGDFITYQNIAVQTHPEGADSCSSMGIFVVCIKYYNSGYITALSHPGNSGSPVLNIWGKLVGVVFAVGSSHMTYMVPRLYVKDFLSQY